MKCIESVKSSCFKVPFFAKYSLRNYYMYVINRITGGQFKLAQSGKFDQILHCNPRLL
jgi:hypothetical protein